MGHTSGGHRTNKTIGENPEMKKAGIFVLLTAMAVLPFVAIGCSESADEAFTIEASGSTSVSPLMEKLGAAYTEANPEINVNVNGTGSSDGVKAANEGTSELGMASRAIKTAEKAFGLDELVIAIDGIAVVVNPANPLSDLTLAQIQGIYKGEIADWSEVGGNPGAIAVVSREPGSGTRGAFEDIVDFEDQLVTSAIEFDGTGGVKAEVSKNVDAIGYISLGSVDDSVKGISVDGAAPSSANVVNGSYRVARPFNVVYRADEIDERTRVYLDWIMSSEGQAIVADKYVPVN